MSDAPSPDVPAALHVLENAAGWRAEFCDLGATLVRLFVPDREGRMADVVLGFDDTAGYLRSRSYHGCVVGRFGNRIARGRFTIDGTPHQLATNSVAGGVPVHLHGGHRGFDRQVWRAEPVRTAGAAALKFHLRSPDGDEGYPGNLDVTVTYRLGDDGVLVVDYAATTDRATPLNLTQHAYFNLRGAGRGDILDHEVRIPAARFVAVGADLIPTGELAPVAGTPLDFTSARRLGARIDADHPQLRFAGGYDHCWVLDHAPGTLGLAAAVREPESGRTLEVWTQEPGVQCYTGNFLDGSDVGKGGVPYARRTGLCLETQRFPDSPNQPTFPAAILRPGVPHRSRTEFRFGVDGGA